MNDSTPSKPVPSPQPGEHHLQKEDLERGADPNAQPCVPLVCNDEECFVPGSELDACAPAADAPRPESEPPDDSKPS